MNTLRKPFLLALAGLAALSLVAGACGDDDDDDTGGEDTATSAATTASGSGDGVVVAIQDNAFPAETEASVGDTVSWDWSGSSNPHSVVWTSDNAADFEDSPSNTGSGDYEITFEEAGTYEYECGVHGSSMTGSIVVS